MAMTVCWRCGIDFDASQFRVDAPCIDCQEVVGGEWVVVTFRGGAAGRDEMLWRAGAVRAALAKGLTDRKTAELLGVHRSTVDRWRRRLGIPPNAPKGGRGSEYWVDSSRHANVAAENGRKGHWNRMHGVSDSQIGARLGKSKESVKRMRQRGVDVLALAGVSVDG